MIFSIFLPLISDYFCFILIWKIRIFIFFHQNTPSIFPLVFSQCLFFELMRCKYFNVSCIRSSSFYSHGSGFLSLFFFDIYIPSFSLFNFLLFKLFVVLLQAPGPLCRLLASLHKHLVGLLETTFLVRFYFVLLKKV